MDRMISKKTIKGLTWVPSLYLIEGLPYVVVMFVSTIIYKRLGFSNAELALYSSLLSLPWILKPLWSPVVDLFSTKRRWIIAMQLLMATGFASIALALPGPHYFTATIAAFMVTAFLSATHDIAADGFYMLALDQQGQSLFVGIRTLFYRLAMILGQGPLVIVAGWLEVSYGDIPRAWATVFYALSALLAVFALYHSLVLPRPDCDRPAEGVGVKSVVREFCQTFADFFRKPGVGAALAFMLLYKLPEAQILRLISPFLLDPVQAGGLGLTTQQVGVIYGMVGLIGLMTGGILGGVAVGVGGLKRWMMPMAWSMSLTCLTFVALSYMVNPPLWVVGLGVVIEQFGYGFGTTAYMMYLIYYATGPRSTSHYAIATGLMSVGMMLPGMVAGWIEQQVGYQMFFLWTMVCCIATVAVARMVKVPSDFGTKR